MKLEGGRYYGNSDHFRKHCCKLATKQSYDVPRTDEILRRADRAYLFPVIAQADAFQQTPVNDETAHRLGFTTPGGVRMPTNRIPFGL
jgi:hypothetical protein